MVSRPQSLACLLALTVAAAACSKEEKKDETARQPLPPVSYFRVDPATAASVRGTIVYRGAKPSRTRLAMDAEAACVQMREGNPAFDEQIVLGPAGGVANAVVYIRTGLEGKKFEAPKEPVVLDQRGCLFTPRVVALQAGGALAVRNSDAIEHNVHPGPKNNREWNEGMTPGAADVIHRFARQEVMIRVKCNLHPWMRAWIGVIEHPYFAVTGPDGAFELKNVPPGDYTLGVWHEKLGELSQPAGLVPSATLSLTLTYQGGDQ